MAKKLTIDSQLVGIPWRKAYKHIGWRQTTNYAAATHDMNPMYIDDEREEGIMAPPMFAVTLGWPIGRNIRDYIDVPYDQEALNRDVHYLLVDLALIPQCSATSTYCSKTWGY